MSNLEDEITAMCVCLDCRAKWMAQMNVTVDLFTLECPACGKKDSFASVMPQEYLKHFDIMEAPVGAMN